MTCQNNPVNRDQLFELLRDARPYQISIVFDGENCTIVLAGVDQTKLKVGKASSFDEAWNMIRDQTLGCSIN